METAGEKSYDSCRSDHFRIIHYCPMKNLILFFLFLLMAFGLHAERLVPIPFTIKATLYLQNTNTATNGAVITTGPTIAYQVTPASLLKSLARAKQAQGEYSAPAFPASAKLVYLVDLDDAAQSHFCVMNTNGAVIVDVADIMAFSSDGNAGTHKGGFNTASGTLVKATYAYMATVTYDDTNMPGGTMKYYLTGLYADHENDVVNTPAGTFKRTIDLRSLCVSGSGTFGDLNVSGGGIAYGTGSATLPLQ